MTRYKVTLSKEEREQLETIIKKGNHSAQKIRNAHILLNCDRGPYSKRMINEEVSKVLNIGMRTIDRVKRRFVEQGLDAVLMRKPTERHYEKKADGEVEAHIISLSCSSAPEGFSRWSLRLLSDQLVELDIVSSISHETVRQVLKKRIETVESKRVDNPPS